MSPALLAVWLSLALFLAALVGGTAFAVARGLAFWRDVKRFSRIMGAASDTLARRADEIGRKAAGAEAAAARLTAATERLARSTAYARVVADAAGDIGATLTGLRGSVPRK